MAKIKVNVKGPIVGGDTAWVYSWLGMSCTSAAGFKRELAKAQDGDTVVVEINSPGGYVNEAAEIYEAIRSYNGEIECRVVGQAASCASFIACAAKSSISPMGYLFLHNCSTACNGNQHDMRQTMESLASIDENIMNAYKAKTGMSDEEIYALMEQNTTISAQRAVELGFIDEITQEGNVTAFNIGANTAGIAAAAPGFIDFGAIDPEKVKELRDAYEKAHEDSAEGGIEMANNANAAEEAKVLDVAQACEEPVNEPVEASVEEPAAAEDEEATEPEPAEEPAEPVEDAEDSVTVDMQSYDQGVTAERERIRGILAIANSVPSEMLANALFDEPIDAQELAFKALSAKQDGVSGYMARAREDAKASETAKVAAVVTDAPAASKAEATIDAMAAMMAKKLK